MEQVAAGSIPPAAQLQPDGAASADGHSLTDDLLAGRFFSIDVRGRVTGWNPRAEAAFGWSTRQVSGESLFDKLLASGLGFGRPELDDFFTAAAGGAGRRVGVLVQHKAGGQLPVELSIVPIQLAKAYELNAFLQDVSTSTASGGAAEIGRVREEHAAVIEMMAGSIERPGRGANESRLAGALIVFHIDAGAMTLAPPPPAPRGPDVVAVRPAAPVVAPAEVDADAARADAERVRAQIDDALADAEASSAELGRAETDREVLRARVDELRAEIESVRAEADAAPVPDPVFESIFDAAAIGMAIKRDGRLVRVNRALTELTGRDAPELLRSDPAELLHPGDRGAQAAAERSLLAGEGPSSCADARLLRATGEEVGVRESTLPLGDGRLLIQFEVTEPPTRAVAEHDGDAPVPADGLVARIRQALDTDDFLIYAQPIIDLHSSDVTQYELLLRMKDESGRLLLPGKFLPAAQEAGLMTAIDQWVVRRAIGLIREAGENGRRLTLEVNISSDSIDDPALADLVDAEVEASGIDPDLLVIEVTEAAALAKIDETIKLAKWIRAAGCRFALDDFGSTFATVKYLKDMPVDYFKLDGDLIVTLPESRTNQLLLNALMDVARGTGTQTIAVYVPDDETLAMLREFGVGYGQGNRVGRPRPVGEI